jgi:regulator of protease activity HflC (stomatin/prohibitin superfamily)
MRDDDSIGGLVLGFGSVTLLLGVLLVTLSMWGCPKYDVYSQEMSGKAELAKATSNRQIKIAEAAATEEAAKHLAQAEIERAKGVAQANKIIGDSLRGNEDYLRYLWIHNLAEAESKGAEVIYIPTEANLPILEASRRPSKQLAEAQAAAK